MSERRETPEARRVRLRNRLLTFHAEDQSYRLILQQDLMPLWRELREVRANRSDDPGSLPRHHEAFGTQLRSVVADQLRLLDRDGNPAEWAVNQVMRHVRTNFDRNQEFAIMGRDLWAQDAYLNNS
jgi:hypothetical protein